MTHILCTNFLDRKQCFLGRKKLFRSKRFFMYEKLFKSKKFLDQKMDLARRLFNDQHPTTSLIDLFGKRYKIDENDKVFR